MAGAHHPLYPSLVAAARAQPLKHWPERCRGACGHGNRAALLLRWLVLPIVRAMRHVPRLIAEGEPVRLLAEWIVFANNNEQRDDANSNADGKIEFKLHGRIPSKYRFGRPRKMTPHQRQEAFQRLAAGETQADVARTYNVDATTIGRLLGDRPFPRGASLAALQ